MTDNQRIVLIGAGSLQFGMGTVGNILRSEVLKGSSIILHDINEEALNLTFRVCKDAIEKKSINYNIEKTLNREEALKDADFIINSIEIPPRFELLNLDYRIPHDFGNTQISGENGGPGGFFHSLRIIPPILDICADVQKICPSALFINFSNPMNRICLAIKRKFPDLKFVGLCHEYHHFMILIEKITNIPIEKLDIKAGGLNHFGVILEIKAKETGKDLYPIIRKNGPEFLYNLNTYDGFKFVAFFLETYGYLPYTTDSHYGEFVHWAWREADIPAVRRFWSFYEELLKGDYEKLKRKIEKGKGANLVKPDEERAIPIIEGILTDANYIEPSVNIPNKRVFTNLPQDITVECPAIINKDGLTGLKLGEYPIAIATLLKEQIALQDLVLEAIFKKSKDLALQALLADPVVDDYWQAKNILNTLLELEKEYIQIELE
ncbi:MAG: Alpha-glucosidase [Promethearchaeota archaeon]|nr:MAG: Alpha-glucosidase [Candidatus Lokiarchaeota archaeon]